MLDVQDPPAEAPEEESGVRIGPKRLKEDTELDMTPMIDCTFLLLIFFMVTSTPDASTELKLAPARNGLNIVVQDAAIISLAENTLGDHASVYLADGKTGAPLSENLSDQEEAIRAYVRKEYRDSARPKKYVLIKVERGVKIKDTSRVAAAASTAFDESGGATEGGAGDDEEDGDKVELHVAVLDQR